MVDAIVDSLFLILLVSLISSWASQRFYPSPESALLVEPSPSDKRTFHRLAWWGGIGVLIIPGIGMIWLWFRVLAQLNLFLANSKAGTLFTHPVASGLLLMIALWLGGASALFLVPLLYKLLLRRKYQAFHQFTSELYGYDWVRAGNAMARIVFAIGVVLSLPVINTYTRITASEILVNDILSLRESRNQLDEDITSIEKHEVSQDEGHLKEEVYYVVNFADGSHWRTNSYRLDRIPVDISASVHHISERAGLPVQTVVD